MLLSNSIVKWGVFSIALSLFFVFFPRLTSLGYTPFESKEKFGLTWGIYSTQRGIQIPEVIVNILVALIATLIIFLLYRLVITKTPRKLSVILISAFTLLFLFFPGTEKGIESVDCGSGVSLSSELCLKSKEIELRTYGLIGDTISSERAIKGSDYVPDVPIIYWNLVIAMACATIVGVSYRIFSEHRKPS